MGPIRTLTQRIGQLFHGCRADGTYVPLPFLAVSSLVGTREDNKGEDTAWKSGGTKSGAKRQHPAGIAAPTVTAQHERYKAA